MSESAKMKSRSSSDSKSLSSTGSHLVIPQSDFPKISPHRELKELARKLIDRDIFVDKFMEWFLERQGKLPSDRSCYFESPFQLDELQDFDFALEGVGFQQLLRMPVGSDAHTSNAVKAEAYLTLEDFLHASVNGLWHAFWTKDGSIPFHISCPVGMGAKFYSVDKAIARGKVDGLCGAALMVNNNNTSKGGWDHIAELALLRDDIFQRSCDDEPIPSLKYIGEALFYAFFMLISRSLSKSTVLRNSNCAYILLADYRFGGVVRLKGDISKMSTSGNKAYDCAIEWLQEHAEITVSSFDQVWNKLGNANWSDVGTLQLLLATFYSIAECKGLPKKSVLELAADHKNRLQKRRVERQLLESHENGRSFYHNQVGDSIGEIVEIQEELAAPKSNELEPMKLERGTVLWLEDSHWQRGFQIHEVLGNNRCSLYSASSLEEPGKLLAVYIGCHPSLWEDMNMWYQVQRQTKVLNIMKQRGILSKYLPQLVASGRIRHPGPCNKQSLGDRCNHPWCGIPILVTSPVGDSVSTIVRRSGTFSAEEALRCCHNCLSALRSTAAAGIRHGDISPDHVIRMFGSDRHSYFVLVNWGHAVVEDRDSPAINFQFSSTYALQEGKLCPASDVESLVYVLYFMSGGNIPSPESLEAALQWRERAWARRTIQQQLGELSAILKAFADYVDSLCGTPYPVDYEIWLRRLSRSVQNEDHGKWSDHNLALTRNDVVADSSGTSRASFT